MLRSRTCRRFRLPKSSTTIVTLTVAVAGCLLVAGCSIPQPWPEIPLYETPTNDPSWIAPMSKEAAMAAMAGHYAHYDIVAYQGETANGPLSTFIVSYGFTDLVIEDGGLVAYDRFCSAEDIANQPFETIFSDEATQAIKPPGAIVDVYQENGAWKVRRPATPTLNGIDGEAPAAALEKARVDLGGDYPRPFIDHAFARRRALDAFETIRGHAYAE